MTVLTLTGKPINWAKPPKPTTKVLWSQRTTSGGRVTGSLRTIAMLDHLNHLAKKRFGRGFIVYQPPYSTAVSVSLDSHKFDAVLDIWIPGVPGFVQQRFVRANGGGGYYRRPSQGFMEHIHFFVLPHRHGSDVSRDYMLAGFKVGTLIDGGWSSLGRVVTSSQIKDYYDHDTALVGHAHDPSWFPPSIKATIFNLSEYVDRHARKQAAAKAA